MCDLVVEDALLLLPALLLLSVVFIVFVSKNSHIERKFQNCNESLDTLYEESNERILDFTA